MQPRQQFVELDFGLWNLKNTSDEEARVSTQNFLTTKHFAVFLETKGHYKSLPNIEGTNYRRVVLEPTTESRSHEDIVVFYDRAVLIPHGIHRIYNFTFQNNRGTLKKSGDVFSLSFKYTNSIGNEGYINVYLAHLIAKKGHETAKQRLIEMLGKIRPDPNERTVFLADFNLKQKPSIEHVDIEVATGTIQFRTLLDQATANTRWKPAIPTYENTTIWACNPWRGHLDNILFDSRCVAREAYAVGRQQADQIISDHQPIAARLRLAD